MIWLRNVISSAPATINQDLGAILLGEKPLLLFRRHR